jgi:hypothetical protein
MGEEGCRTARPIGLGLTAFADGSEFSDQVPYRKSPGCSNKALGTPPGTFDAAAFYLQNGLFFE